MTPETENKCSFRILLVDDEEDLVNFLARLLLKRGCTVTATNSGLEAIAAVESRTYDVAIVDLKMPHMDGIEVLERIREIQPFLEVIMLTGHGSIESAHEAGLMRAYRYLLKPYKVDELLKLIKEAADHREAFLEAAYQKEMEELITPGHTPKDILVEGEELRRKYERK